MTESVKRKSADAVMFGALKVAERCTVPDDCRVWGEMF